jgi:hypothetical protein
MRSGANPRRLVRGVRRRAASAFVLPAPRPAGSHAVALPRTAHGPESIDHCRLKPDVALARVVGFVLIAHAAERERGADRIEGGLADRDADGAFDGNVCYFVGFHYRFGTCTSAI